MKCPKCNGRVLKMQDSTSCINCGYTVKEETKIYIIAINTNEPAPVGLFNKMVS